MAPPSTSTADFDAFVVARGTALLRTAVLLTGDRGLAEDLVQEALMKAWLRWDRIGGLDHVEAYVRRILATSHLGRFRRRRVTETHLDVDHAASQHDLDLRHDTLTALSSLPRAQRAVIVLRYYEDLTEAQTAAALGCTVGTVKSHTARAMARLRDIVVLAEVPHD